MFKKSFGLLQQIGKSLMLPVSVLPVAGILLGVGSAKLSWIPPIVSKMMADAGGSVFTCLPLIFAIGVALGLTNNDGVSALAAVVGYAVLLATMGVMATSRGLETKAILGFQSLDTGVFGGILVGGFAAYLFNRYYRISLPPYLGFFAGKRFVPIVTALTAVVTGFALSFIWPPIQAVIRSVGDWAAYGNPTLAVTVYGVVERLLVPFGLHHIWNVPFFNEMGSFTMPNGEVLHGDMTRFMKGDDPTAGILGGGFLFKMWGLPAAAIAIAHAAKIENRARIYGIMASGALTSFLTGITEPIEFSFLFVAPLLYVIHALLCGTAFMLMQLAGTHMGFSFSQGFIDYVILFAKDTRPWVVFVLGPIYAVVYYVLFRWIITRFDLKTPGREDETVATESAGDGVGADSLAGRVLEALGGAENLSNLDACITRLRVGLKDVTKASPERLKALGAAGVVVVGDGMQAIFGTQSENLKTDIEHLIRAGGGTAAQATPVKSTAPVSVTVSTESLAKSRKILSFLGGPSNVSGVSLVALTRVRVTVRDDARVDEAGLGALAVPLMRPKRGVLHLVVGPSEATEFTAALASLTNVAAVS